MTEHLKEFRDRLYAEDRCGCVQLATGWLSRNEIDIVRLYTDVLTPVLNNMSFEGDEGQVAIWKEHVRSSIVRTVIENCHPFVHTQEKLPVKGKAIVVCPPEELHEIGARMMADFFTMLGYDATFVGANTPIDDALAGIAHVRPDYVALGASSFYNLLALRKIVEALRKLRKSAGLKFKIIVGGRAFIDNPQMKDEMGADELVQDFEGLKKLLEGGA